MCVAGSVVSGSRDSRDGEHPWGAALRALREAPRRRTLYAGGAALFSLLVYLLVRHLLKTSMVDMIVYRAEGTAVATHHGLYTFRVTQWQLPATYPPFAALFFTPTAWIPVPLLRVFVTSFNVLLIGVFAHFSFRLAGWPRREWRPAAVMLATGFGVWLEPIWTTLRYGQINLLIGCLVLWDLTRSDANRLKGIGIGLAAGMKLTPALFAVYLLLTGRVRAAMTATATGLGTMLLGWLLLPSASWDFWTRDVFDTSRVGKEWIVDNQSLRGVICRLLRTTNPGTTALVATAIVAVLGLAVAVGTARCGRWLPRAEAWGSMCTAVTALLISPISWSHHWVWVLPMIVLLFAEAATEAEYLLTSPGAHRRRWRATAVVTTFFCCSQCLWMVPRKGSLNLRIPLWEQPFAAIYPLIGLAFLWLAGERLRRRVARHREDMRWLRSQLPRPRSGRDSVAAA
jgi:alpha-1,2-mannosyltransferase